MQSIKIPVNIDCKVCHKTLQKAVVCEKCFTESVVTPFSEFKAQTQAMIEKIKIIDRELPPESLEKAKAIRRLWQRRKQI